MSQDHVETIREVHAALNRRDVEGIVDHWHEEAEFRPIMSSLESEVYVGHDGLRRWLDELYDHWDVFEAHADAFFDLGDKVLAFGGWHARGRVSGADLDVATAAWLARFRDGKVVWYKTFTDRTEAIAAAGTTEAELEAL